MDRQLALFCNEFHADVKFIIQKENIEYPAHKLIIGHASDVLNKMVYGNETTLPTSIIVPTHSSNDFLPVLKYLYTGDVEWTLDNYQGVLEVGKYFGLSEMEDLFKLYVADTVNYDTVLEIFARFFHVNDYLSRTAMKIIQLKLNRILISETKKFKFFELPAEALSQILQMNELGVTNERVIFDTMMKWVEKINDKEIVSTVLGIQLKFIRYADEIIKGYGQFPEYLHDKVDTRRKIVGFYSSSERLQQADQSAIEQSSEIVQITSRDKTIRLHGFSIVSPEPVYVKVGDQFEAIPCYRSRIYQGLYFDLMFENPIEIASNESVEIKVPVSYRRNDFLDNDLFLVRNIQMEQAGKNLPMETFYVSTSFENRANDDSDDSYESDTSEDF